MASLAATTPSPPPTIHTPDTPRFGYGDSWEPYSPRKSARISSKQSSTARTPSPKSSRVTKSSPPQFKITRAPNNKQQQQHQQQQSFAGAMTPARSPRKKHQPARSDLAGSDSLTAEGTINAAAFLGPPPGSATGGKSESTTLGHTAISSQTGMLPTPAKTPSRRHAEQNEANIQAIARNLFHSKEDQAAASLQQTRQAAVEAAVEAALPTRTSRRPKKYSGNSMNSFTAEEIEEPIKIFTDSKDRIPVVDTSADNPFLGSRRVAHRVNPASKDMLVEIPGTGIVTVDEANKREDGMVFKFRGKSVWRPFTAPEDSNGESASDSSPRKRVTRSSIKPRLLFPPQPEEQLDMDAEPDVDMEDDSEAATEREGEDDEEAATDCEEDDDEEADTDIEESNSDGDDQQPFTPANQQDDDLTTPKAPRFAAVSPPATARRATRSTQNLLAVEATPVKAVVTTGRRSRRSPFDDWQRVKTAPADPAADPAHSHGHKRPAGETPPTPSTTKRARN